MMGQFQIYLVFWALLLVTISGEDDIGASKECVDAPFVPGYNLAGEGFDVVTMERKGAYVINMEEWDLGNGTCKLRTNDNMNGIKQKLPAAVVFWRTLPKCSNKVSSQVFESSEALVNDSSSALAVSWKVGLDVKVAGAAVGSTHSREAKFGMTKSKEDKYSFTKHEVSCSFYRYRLAENLHLHAEFLQAIKKLPASYDPDAYRNLITTYGTHFTTSVMLGGRIKAVTAIKTCQAAVSGLTDTAVKDCLDVEASASYSVATVKAESHFCKELKKKMGTNEKFSAMFSERQTEIIGGNINGEDLLFSGTSSSRKNWFESLKSVPDIVHYTLKPLHFLLSDTHPARQGLKKAVEEYIIKNALMKVCSESCKIDSSWNSKLLGECSFEIRSGVVSDACAFKYGTFFFTYKVTCAPSLKGPRCDEHEPSPMASHLADIFSSRNGVLMMGQFQIYLVFWALLLVTISGEDDIGASKECVDAPFVPGYNLAGEGFDVVTMERKGAYVINMEEWDLGNGTCNLRTNNYMNGIKQKLPAAVVFWRTLPKCSNKVSSQVFESSEALVNDSSSALAVSWKVGLDVKVAGAAVGSTHSREAKFGMTKSKEDKYSFTKHEVSCSFYRYRLAENLHLHAEFLQAIKKLPASYDPDAYRNLITTYGTHFTTSVMLGGRIKAVTAIKTCQAAVSGLTDTAVKDCLDVEASGSYSVATVKAESHFCKELKKKMGTNEKFSAMFSERQTEIIGGNINVEDLLFSGTSSSRKNWFESLKSVPDIVHYTLKPLHFLLSDKHPARQGLRKAVEEYIIKNALMKVCSESCKIVTCAPSLKGPRCDEHEPSPMASHLADIFSSRNGVLMMGQFQIYLVFWALLLVTISGEDDIGASKECVDAPFVPGYNLAGEGFDVVTMERKGAYVINMEEWDLGNGTCNLRTNNYMNGIKQKLPAAVVFWRTLPKCSNKVSSQVFESSEALVNDSSSALAVSWKVGLDVKVAGAAVGSTHSREAKFGMTKSKEDKYSFTKHEVSCSFYRYRLAENLHLHAEFLQAIKKLPASYDPDAYRNLITTYGTHFTTSVMLGGRIKAVTAIKTCQAAVSGLTDTAVKDCLDVEASGSYSVATVKAESHFCKELKKKMGTNEKFSAMFSERQTEIIGGNINVEDLLFSGTSSSRKNWFESLKSVPDIVHYTLKPLHFLLSDKHPARQGLRKAVEEYIIKNALMKVCSESCKIVTCAPSLKGPRCDEHEPSPMASHLADIFSSRNGVLMMGQFQIYLVFWALLLVTISGEDDIGASKECVDAPFVPGYNLAGEGFDVVTMERKGAYVINMEEWDLGNGTCNLRANNYMNGIKQKLPAAVVFWRTLPKCSNKVSSQVFESSEALVNDSSSALSVSWKVGLDVKVAGAAVGSTHSREAKFGMTKSKEDKYSFTKHEVSCSFYRYGLAENVHLHAEFLQAIKNLPASYDPDAYRNLITTYGTHFTTSVMLGGRIKAVTAIKTCQAAVSGLTDTAVKDCLDVEASASYSVATVKAESHFCKEKKKKMGTNEKFSSMFSERQTEIIGGNINGEDLLFSGSSHPNSRKNWFESLKSVPDIVHYTLKPLHFLLNEKHPARKGLKRAVEEYIIKNALMKVCSEPCKIGLATLTVYNLKADGLYGDVFSETDGAVSVTYGTQIKRTATIDDNDNPRCDMCSQSEGPTV
ncbi:perforin-1 [Pimephales promelas]|nr:perforin-1 [Pimephales promelas]